MDLRQIFFQSLGENICSLQPALKSTALSLFSQTSCTQVINLQLSSKISLKLDFNSSLLWEYGR